MSTKLILILVTLGISLMALAQPKQNLSGHWISKGQQEVRTLTFEDDGKGQFLSEYLDQRCLANLETIIDGQFVMASGIAKNCPQKDNAVAFEFYCQQTTANNMRCKINSSHQKTGNAKQGVEDFQRQK